MAEGPGAPRSRFGDERPHPAALTAELIFGLSPEKLRSATTKGEVRFVRYGDDGIIAETDAQNAVVAVTSSHTLGGFSPPGGRRLSRVSAARGKGKGKQRQD